MKFLSLVIGLILVSASQGNAQNIELCDPTSFSAMSNETFEDWNDQQMRMYNVTNDVSCKSVEGFRDGITSALVGISIVGVYGAHYIPHIGVKLFFAGTAGGLQMLSLYAKNIPCDDGKEEMERKLTETVCVAADRASGGKACPGANSNYILDLGWENGITYENMCRKMSGGHDI